MKKLLRNRLVIILSSALCFAAAYFISLKTNDGFINKAKKFEEVFHEKEQYSKNELSDLADKAQKLPYAEIFTEKQGYYEDLFEEKGIVFLIFEKDYLSFWTNNTVAVDPYLPSNNFNNKIVRLPNGWFGVEELSAGNKKLFALILLKKEYPYQNKYLLNEFQSSFDIDRRAELFINDTPHKESVSLEDKTIDIYEEDGHYVCTLKFPANGKVSWYVYFFYLLFNGIAVLLLLRLLELQVDIYKERIGRIWSVLLLCLSVGLLRYLSIIIDFPPLFYTTKIFSPELYGDATFVWLRSLGDLLINALLVFYLVGYAYANIHTFCMYRKAKLIQSFFVLLVLFLLSAIINYVFEGLINNSSIPFTITDFFSLNGYTYLALIILGLLFTSYFLIIDKTVEVILFCNIKNKLMIPVALLSAGVFIIISHLIGTVDLVLIFWPLLLFAIVVWVKSKQTGYTFSTIVVLLFIISFCSADIVQKFTLRKEHDNRRILAQKLIAEQDPLAEHLFSEAKQLILKDTLLLKTLYHKHPERTQRASVLKETFADQVLSKYFGGYWEKYEIRISAFDTTCLPLTPGLYPMNYFDEQIALHCTPTMSENLYSLNNTSGKLSYIARIPVFNSKAHRFASLYLEFDSRIISEEVGFPELMLDRKLGLTNDLLDYSYAKYKNNKLVSYHGKFSFAYTSNDFLVNDSSIVYPDYNFASYDGYNHLIYRADDASLIVISKKDEGWITWVTSFSYLFAYYSLLLLLFVLTYFFIVKRNFHLDSFRIKMQFVLVSMVLFSLLFFGAGTIYYIDQQYEKQIRQSVRDKTLSALVEGMQEMGEEVELNQTKSDYFSYILKRMSNVFLTDISLYDLQGNLIGSSQMKLFDEGLMSRKISPDSYYHLAIKKNVEFIHNEKIGELEYLSAYCSFRNNDGKPIGFLNIPYFARQSELEKEISTIISALINVYVLLFVISLILALVISEYFTNPLKLIQEKLSKIKLGKANEPIQWKSDDEIGSLVNEYNRMIDELQKSADLLAKSERETAWREMAKQVAHEIKNPLTPMKLSIQHLQKTWKNKEDDMDKKIERISQTLIEQIDTLSTIASEFSNFAKMPSSNNEKVELKKIVENSIEIFKDSTIIDFSFNASVSDAYVYADKEQLLRVFNNLLKNAIQAIPADRNGKIEISLAKKDNNWLVKIKDNGTGISEETMRKIFTPNFTTKTAGMGLGLAMVKSIVETIGGKIWFETMRDSGATFFVSLPVYSN